MPGSCPPFENATLEGLRASLSTTRARLRWPAPSGDESHPHASHCSSKDSGTIAQHADPRIQSGLCEEDEPERPPGLHGQSPRET